METLLPREKNGARNLSARLHKLHAEFFMHIFCLPSHEIGLVERFTAARSPNLLLAKLAGSFFKAVLRRASPRASNIKRDCASAKLRGTVPSPPALSAEVRGELLDQLDGQTLLLAGALEDQQGHDRLAVDVARLENGHQLRRETLQIVRTPLCGEETGEIERDQGRVVAHAPLQKLSLDLPEGGFGRTAPAEAEIDVPLHPAQADEVERLRGGAQMGFDFGKETLGLAVALGQDQRAEEIEAGVDEELCLLDGVDRGSHLEEEIDRGAEIPLSSRILAF